MTTIDLKSGLVMTDKVTVNDDYELHCFRFGADFHSDITNEQCLLCSGPLQDAHKFKRSAMGTVYHRSQHKYLCSLTGHDMPTPTCVHMFHPWCLESHCNIESGCPICPEYSSTELATPVTVNSNSVLGVDIGGVIIESETSHGSNDTIFSEDFIDTPIVPYSIAVLTELQLFNGRVHFVSKAGRKVSERTRLFLDHHRLWDITGLSPETNLHFCKERKDKEPICKALGVTHFLDDRVDVLRHLQGTVPFLFLLARDGTRSAEKEKSNLARSLPQARVISSWKNFGEVLSS